MCSAEMAMCIEQVTGFGYDHDEAWAANVELFKQFTDASRGVRRLGAAAVDLCHTAMGMCHVMLISASTFSFLPAHAHSCYHTAEALMIVLQFMLD